ncbi:hypothetical protein [Chondromyces apiculatus]|uniref:Uncharacterized protein n=1 Tax=Chondromyces apiculatus DSM 436 TaxID=1192034 RepID=A0A017SXG6_9BACT|nr:hypothetical protein [Chondromyces apiculatus]EYF01638.1 Hypothetical protein CAP_7957 [Chondromyces apiculatus DSM 436]
MCVDLGRGGRVDGDARRYGWYAMDVEFKFDDDAAPDLPPTLYIKQARPYPGRWE